MANSPIFVMLNEGTSFEIKSNTPDFDGLLKKITELRDTIDPDEISISCEDESFDKEGFKDILAKSTKDYLEAISVEKKMLDQAIGEIKKRDENSSS